MQNHHRFLHNDHIFARINNHQGVTLVEVLIALLVLGILFVPVNNAFLQSVHLNQHLQQRVAAVREAQTAMEVALSIMDAFEAADQHEQNQSREKEIEEGIEARSNDVLKVSVKEGVEEELIKEWLIDETPLPLAEAMAHKPSGLNSTGLIQPGTTVEIAPLHEDSPFFIITATSPGSNTNAHVADSSNNTTLTTLHLTRRAPWLTPKEYRVVTP